MVLVLVVLMVLVVVLVGSGRACTELPYTIDLELALNISIMV